jgi:putative DNA primase/helicase
MSWDTEQPVQPDDPQDEALGPRPVTVCLANVQPEPLHWLWPGRIPLGKLTLIAGDPGLGKSFVTLDVAARVSSGTPWPDLPDEETASGSVILLSAEDDLADTIRPRLDAAGADAARVVALKGVLLPESAGVTHFSLAMDIPQLEEVILQVEDVRLVVIDPVTAYLGRADGHKNAEIRGLLAPLAELASAHRVSVVCVTHLNKAAGTKALYRAMGSLAFAAAARAVWLVTRDKDDPARRLMLPAKMNLAPEVTGLA